MPTFSRFLRKMVGSKHGAALALVVLGMLVFLSMVAVAVDVGMLLGARTASQRAADGAALAGAASLITSPTDEARAKLWAEEYAEHNEVHGEKVDLRPDEGSPPDVEVLLAEQKVRVRVRNIKQDRDNAVPTVFARVMGRNEMDVTTLAAAEVVEAGSVACPFPATIADRWLDRPNGPNGNDALFDPNDDKYEPYSDLADDPVVDKSANGGTQCPSFGNCPGVTGDHASYTGFNYTGFVGGEVDRGQVFELKTQNNQTQNPPGPSDPLLLLPGGAEPHTVSPCVQAHAWRCWWDPDGGGGGANELNAWVSGCPNQNVSVGAGDWILPKNGQTQSVVMTAKDVIDDNGGTGWTWNGTCMHNGTACMSEVSLNAAPGDPAREWFDKRHRNVPVIDPAATLYNGDPMLVMRWECVFLEKVARSWYVPGSFVESQHGSGPRGKWNLYVRFATGCRGMGAGEAIGQGVKALRLVE